MTEITKQDGKFEIVEQVMITGDLTKLTPEQRVSYYNRVCESLGLNPYTQPFAYIILNSKLQLYARKDATEQLRKIRNISITHLDKQVIDDLYIVTAFAVAPDGRTDQATGVVNIGGLKGEAKANAFMKAETKAKRRVTLSIAGLGWADESEVDSIPGARLVAVDNQTGEIITPDPARATPVAGGGVIQHRQLTDTQPDVVIDNAPPPAPESITQSKQFKRLMAEGTEIFGKDWDPARHWLVETFTARFTPDNIRHSSSLLTEDECEKIADKLAAEPAKYRRLFGEVSRMTDAQSVAA